MKYLLLLLLLACGQSNQALDCIRQGNQCRDELKGEKGDPGDRGEVGPAGRDGESIVGPPGSNGMDGIDGTIIEPMTVCPLVPGAYPEVLLCIDQSLYAVFNDSGTTTRYVRVPPGTYRTTDSRNVHFRVINACMMECL